MTVWLFRGVPVIKESRADRVTGADLIVKKGMGDYSGWGWVEHVTWISELSGLEQAALYLLVSDGYLLLTDESVSKVWLVSNDYYKSKARLIYTEEGSCDE
jgi:hypothetical protein